MIYLSVILLYLLILIGIGIVKSRKINTQSDFALAGRTLTPWILVGTMLATWIGTGSILGNAGKTYEIGMAALLLPIGSIMGIILLTKIAGKVRNVKKFTVPEIIGDRYGSFARNLCVFALVSAYMVIVSYQYNAGGAVIYTVFSNQIQSPFFTIETATIIAAIFIILYTMLAGLLSVAFTDAANGILMTISLVIAFPILWIKAGGFNGMETAFKLVDKSSHMQFFGIFSTFDIINFCLPPFLLILGDANMYQRFSASKDHESATKATIILIFAVLIIELLIIASSWVASSLIVEDEVGKYVLIHTAYDLLPAFLGAMMLATIVGIIISTADSFLLIPANTLIKDVYLKYINENASEKKIVGLSRLLVLILGILAYIVSIGFSKSAGFFERALYAYTIYGASITPALLAALFWKRSTKEGAVTSILSGIIITFLWKEFPILWNWLPSELYFSLDEVLPAILVSSLVLFIVSIFTQEKESAIK